MYFNIRKTTTDGQWHKRVKDLDKVRSGGLIRGKGKREPVGI